MGRTTSSPAPPAATAYGMLEVPSFAGLHDRQPSAGLSGHGSFTGLHDQVPSAALPRHGSFGGLHDQHQPAGLPGHGSFTGLHEQLPPAALSGHGSFSGLHEQHPAAGLHDPGAYTAQSAVGLVPFAALQPAAGPHNGDAFAGLHDRQPSAGLQDGGAFAGLHDRQPSAGLPWGVEAPAHAYRVGGVAELSQAAEQLGLTAADFPSIEDGDVAMALGDMLAS